MGLPTCSSALVLRRVKLPKPLHTSYVRLPYHWTTPPPTFSLRLVLQNAVIVYRERFQQLTVCSLRVFISRFFCFFFSARKRLPTLTITSESLWAPLLTHVWAALWKHGDSSCFHEIRVGLHFPHPGEWERLTFGRGREKENRGDIAEEDGRRKETQRRGNMNDLMAGKRERRPLHIE